MILQHLYNFFIFLFLRRIGETQIPNQFVGIDPTELSKVDCCIAGSFISLAVRKNPNHSEYEVQSSILESNSANRVSLDAILTLKRRELQQNQFSSMYYTSCLKRPYKYVGQLVSFQENELHWEYSNTDKAEEQYRVHRFEPSSPKISYI